MGDITVSPHPSADKLRQLGLGQLDEAEASLIEEHVSHCEPCGRTLADVGTDTFIHALRSSTRLPPLGGVTAAVDAADRATPVAIGGITSAEAAAPPELPPELLAHPRYR